MASFRALLHRFHASTLLAVSLTLLTEALPLRAFSQEPATASLGGSTSQPQIPAASRPQPSDPQAQPQSQASKYDSAIFKNRLSIDQLAFLNQFVGRKSGDALRDKQFRKLMRSLLPDCIFHYGWDMSINDAMEKALDGSKLPVELRDERYLIVSGSKGPYLYGRGFLWIDMKDGIALGGFYFHPTNGEPTPTVTIFSRQVKEAFLGMSQLPPAFARDFRRWSAESNVPARDHTLFHRQLESKDSAGARRRLLRVGGCECSARLRTDECRRCRHRPGRGLLSRPNQLCNQCHGVDDRWSGASGLDSGARQHLQSSSRPAAMPRSLNPRTDACDYQPACCRATAAGLGAIT